MHGQKSNVKNLISIGCVGLVIEEALRDRDLVSSVICGELAEILKHNFAISVAVKSLKTKLKAFFIKWSPRVYELADVFSVLPKHCPVDEAYRVCVDLFVDESSLDQLLFL